MINRPSIVARILLGVAIAAASGPVLAQSSRPADPASAPAAAPPSTAPSATPATGQPRPFKDVAKDAKETPGFFTLWEKDDKVWIELRPDQLDKPFYFAVNRTQGLGERGIDGPFMLWPSHIAMFRRSG